MDETCGESHHFELHDVAGVLHWRPVRTDDAYMYLFNVCEYDTPSLRRDLSLFPRKFAAFPTCLWCMGMLCA